jgi:hypothetical protein
MVRQSEISTGSGIRTSEPSGMANGDDFPRWDVDSAEFCARIERVRSPIKIVLKADQLLD